MAGHEHDDRQAQFKQWITRLGVPKDVQLHSDVDLEWMWSDPDCSHLLDWLMKNVDETNVVTKSQQNQLVISFLELQ